MPRRMVALAVLVAALGNGCGKSGDRELEKVQDQRQRVSDESNRRDGEPEKRPGQRPQVRGEANTRDGELEKLQGRWRQVSVETDGRVATVPENLPAVTTITGDKWIAEAPDGNIELLMQIDPSRDPKAIDKTLKGKGPQGADLTQKSIYKIDGDTLTVCSPRSEQGITERPKDFKSTGGSQVFVYKRVK